MDHHKWRRVISVFPTGRISNEKWECSSCKAVVDAKEKPKSRRDHQRLGVGRSCSLEMIRIIHEV